MENDDTEDEVIVKRRKRIHESTSRKRKSNKNKRMAGLEYVGFTTKDNKIKQDKIRKAREMGPPCSSKYCEKSKVRHCEKFDESTRSKIFRSFWDLSPWSAKQIFVQCLVKSVNVNNTGSGTNGSRRNPLKFFLYFNGERLQVFCSMEFSEFFAKIWFCHRYAVDCFCQH